MRYHNKIILDLDKRILREYEKSNDAFIIKAEIDEITIEKVCKKFNYDKELDVNKITSYVICMYVKRIKKNLKKCVVRCFLTYKQNKSSKLVVYGIIYDKDIDLLLKLWKYGNIEASALQNVVGFIKAFVRIYKKSFYYKKLYASYLFGSECYQETIKKLEEIKIPLLEGEFFKEIPFFKNYFISNFSRVISRKRKKEILLKVFDNQYRKKCATLCQSGKNHKIPLGLLMGKTFFNLDFYNKNYVLYHKDGDLNNNILANLEIRNRDSDEYIETLICYKTPGLDPGT